MSHLGWRFVLVATIAASLVSGTKCSGACGESCAITCAGCKETVLCAAVLPAAEAVDALLAASFASRSVVQNGTASLDDRASARNATRDLTAACVEILDATDNRYGAAPYQTTCVTDACGPEICTRGGCIEPGDTSCDVECYACRDAIVCDVLLDRLAIIVNTTSDASDAFEKPAHDLGASVLADIGTRCQSSGAIVSFSPVHTSGFALLLSLTSVTFGSIGSAIV